jgi:hypothetical protein
MSRTTPDADTLYSPALLDLSRESYVLSVPDSKGRCYLMPMLDNLQADKESNWLPAPKDKFVLLLRLYWRKEDPPSILDGTQNPAAVRKVA